MNAKWKVSMRLFMWVCFQLSVLSDDGILNCDVDKGRRGSVRDDPAPVGQTALARKATKESDRVDFVKYFGAQFKAEPKKRSKVDSRLYGCVQLL